MILGGLGVGVVGLAVTLAIIVAKARAGFFTFSLDDLATLRWESVPVLAGILLGGVLGFRRPLALDRAALRGFLALTPGAIVGAVAGRLAWGTEEGTWAAGIIGGALALLAGTATVIHDSGRDAYPVRSGMAGSVALLALGLLGALGVAGTPDFDPLEFEAVRAVDMPDPEDVDAVAFLVGDAGDADIDTSPLLRALRSDVERWSDALGRDSATSVLYLGDLVYPSGVHDRDHPRFPTDSARLWDQIAVVGGEAARRNATIGLFITGNHDWGNSTGQVGFERVANLESELSAARAAGHRVALLPRAGQPGPEIRDLRNNVRLLFLDTHWFLQQRSVGEHERFFARLDSALQSAGDREVIIVAHHPFRSAGPHGTMILSYHDAGIELLLRQSGSLVQDLNSSVYSGLLAGLRDSFARAPRPPLVFAGGHDHSLQVFESGDEVSPRYSLVSGAGSKLSAVREAPGLAWGGSRPGYMMVVFRKDDGVDLFVIAGDPALLKCADPEAVDACMVEGVAAFEIVYSASLLAPTGRDVPIPEAARDTAAG